MKLPPLHFTLQEAEHRITYWLERGYVHYSDRHTRSSHMRRVCPECLGTVRDLPALVRCVRCCNETLKPDATN